MADKSIALLLLLVAAALGSESPYQGKIALKPIGVSSTIQSVCIV